jgi:hypothetical protein
MNKALAEFSVFSNDEEQGDRHYATIEEAEAVCEQLNKSADPDTKFWVAPTWD